LSALADDENDDEDDVQVNRSSGANHMPKTIGFIGLGIMGKPMAKHLSTPAIPGGLQPHHSKARELVAMGARQVHSPKGSQRIQSHHPMVADSPSGTVILGPAGVIEGVKSGSVVI
jgi:2-hydroxy-3-oxopropionate reductase